MLNYIEQAVRKAATICPAPCKLTFDLLTLKVVSESRVMWATSVPILVFLGFSLLDLGPMYATDRGQTRMGLMPPTPGAGHNKPDGRSHLSCSSELMQHVAYTL